MGKWLGILSINFMVSVSVKLVGGVMARIVWLQWTYLIPTDVLWNMNYLLTKLTSIVQQYVKIKCFMTQTEKESTFTNQKNRNTE